MMMELLAPVVRSQIDESIKEKSITATAHLDPSIHISNHKEVFNTVISEWRQWICSQNGKVSPGSGPVPVARYGDDVCYRIPNEQLAAAPTDSGGTTEPLRKETWWSHFWNRVFDDICSSFWKFGSYVLTICLGLLCTYNFVLRKSVEAQVREYYIVKTLLLKDIKYHDFIITLDKAIEKDGINCVVKNLKELKSKS